MQRAECPCFTPGTMIATDRGLRPVEQLRPGDLVVTRDDGLAEVLWTGRRDITRSDLRQARELAPVLVRRGALDGLRPLVDMLVSPNHRFLVSADRSNLAPREAKDCLVAAKHLEDGHGIHRAESLGVSYVHFMTRRHALVLANGAWTETFRPERSALAGIANAQRLELEALFPELDLNALPVRPLAEDVPLWRRRMDRIEARRQR